VAAGAGVPLPRLPGTGEALLLRCALCWDSHPPAFPRNHKTPYQTLCYGWANICKSKAYQLISSGLSLRLSLQGPASRSFSGALNRLGGCFERRRAPFPGAHGATIFKRVGPKLAGGARLPQTWPQLLSSAFVRELVKKRRGFFLVSDVFWLQPNLRLLKALNFHIP